MTTPIYIVKVVGSHERREALGQNLHCEHWDGVPLTAFNSRRAATDFCRVSNKRMHDFGQYEIRLYYVVAIIFLNH